jgi:hypothetical protein
MRRCGCVRAFGVKKRQKLALFRPKTCEKVETEYVRACAKGARKKPLGAKPRGVSLARVRACLSLRPGTAGDSRCEAHDKHVQIVPATIGVALANKTALNVRLHTREPHDANRPRCNGRRWNRVLFSWLSEGDRLQSERLYPSNGDSRHTCCLG